MLETNRQVLFSSTFVFLEGEPPQSYIISPENEWIPHKWMVYVATHFLLWMYSLLVAWHLHSTLKNVRKYSMNEFSFKKCALGSMRCATGILRTLGSTLQPLFFYIFASSSLFISSLSFESSSCCSTSSSS